MKAERNYSIDLLKCISMLMVVVLHLNQYGLKDAEYDAIGVIGITSALGQSFCIVGVNIFVLITGYYLSAKDVVLTRKNLINRYKRLIPLWIQVEMYSIGIYLILCAFPQSGVQFGYRQLIKQALPLMTNQYWFFTVYVLLVLVSPFINQLICRLEQIEYRNMLIVLIAVFSLVPTLNIIKDISGTGYGYSLVWFIVLYCIGGYIRRFDIKTRRYGIWYLAFVFILFACRMLIIIGPSVTHGFLDLFSNTYTSVFVLGASVSLFLAFLKSKKQYRKSGKMIALVSSLSFAVYLVHEHNLLRDILWERLICLGQFTDYEGECLIVMLISIVGIYAFSIIVEFIRVRLLDLAMQVKRKIWNNNKRIDIAQ